MIKNIMKNIGVKPAEVKEKPIFDRSKLRELQAWLPSQKYKEYVDYIKKNHDIDESFNPAEVEEILGEENFYSDIIKAMPTEKVKSFETDYAKLFSDEEE